MEFTGSAAKHGISRADATHAVRNAFAAFAEGEGFTMFIGPDYAGRILEIGVVERGGEAWMVHAMRARSKYL